MVWAVRMLVSVQPREASPKPNSGGELPPASQKRYKLAGDRLVQPLKKNLYLRD